VIGHDLQFNEVLSPPFDLLGKNNLQPFIYWLRQYFTPVLRAEHYMVPADRNNSAVAVYISHTSSRR
jgi:hypothetical protein